jgi:hypothetical protein
MWRSPTKESTPIRGPIRVEFQCGGVAMAKLRNTQMSPASLDEGSFCEFQKNSQGLNEYWRGCLEPRGKFEDLLIR